MAVLAGGIGGSKLLTGLYAQLEGRDLTVVGNTGDDLRIHGLRVCPDLDTITYTLTGLVEPERGWGRAGETFHCLQELSRLGADTWFQLGDRDLALHLQRTRWLAEGLPLSHVTQRIAQALGLGCRLLPMSEDYRPTCLETSQGRLHVQEYFVREGTRPRVKRLIFPESRPPAEGVSNALRQAEAIVIAPSNPFLSIQPILALDGVRRCLQERRQRVMVVTPVVGGKSLKGPTAKMLSELGHQVTAGGVARIYQPLARHFILDQRDAGLRRQIEAMGYKVHLADTVMNTRGEKIALARRVLDIFQDHLSTQRESS
ncbi:MAG TPA: 2-phospho-L-lactate transferase [Acidobacteriota bacterium]|nr:2-phospho-L-lactate transferase [Acidobacteriota bacterium]